jgi:hypothetical protein
MFLCFYVIKIVPVDTLLEAAQRKTLHFMNGTSLNLRK